MAVGFCFPYFWTRGGANGGLLTGSDHDEVSILFQSDRDLPVKLDDAASEGVRVLLPRVVLARQQATVRQHKHPVHIDPVWTLHADRQLDRLRLGDQ